MQGLSRVVELCNSLAADGSSFVVTRIDRFRSDDAPSQVYLRPTIRQDDAHNDNLDAAHCRTLCQKLEERFSALSPRLVDSPLDGTSEVVVRLGNDKFLRQWLWAGVERSQGMKWRVRICFAVVVACFARLIAIVFR